MLKSLDPVLSADLLWVLAAMGHGDMGGMKHDDPNSVLVEPGKTAELTWTFSKAGALEFACNLPGHYQAGMVGEFALR